MQTPDDYRKRATFLRKLADQAMTEALKESYLELAANWDALAAEADSRGTQEGPGQSASPQPR
jgi:hypothetical protein